MSVIRGFSRAVVDVVWRPNKLEFATVCYGESVRAWRVVEDNNESERVSVELMWASGTSSFAASGAVLQDVVGLSAMNRKFLEQCGGTGLSPADNNSRQLLQPHCYFPSN